MSGWRSIGELAGNVIEGLELNEGTAGGAVKLNAGSPAATTLREDGRASILRRQGEDAAQNSNGKRTPAETGASYREEVVQQEQKTNLKNMEPSPAPKGRPVTSAHAAGMSLIVARSRAAPRGRANRPRSATIIEMSAWKAAHARSLSGAV